MTPTLAGASKSPERSWPSARTRVKVLHQRRYQNMLPWPFQIPLRNGLCSLKFSLKQTPGLHKRYGKLMLSMECKTLFSASFTQETRSWLWPMLPRWRLAPARYEASLRRTQRTLSKWSGRSFQRFSSSTLFFFFFTSSIFHICVLSAQIPYLGFCACEEMGETGVWQLADPPILPLTHGPNHGFSWREMLMQDWRKCSLLRLLAVPNCWIFILTHTAVLCQKRHTRPASVKDKHADIFVFNHCTHRSGLCGSWHQTSANIVQTLFPVVTGNHGCRFLCVCEDCVGVTCTQTLTHTHTVTTFKTRDHQNYFSTCSCDPPSKEKHKLKICFILEDAVSSWSLDERGSSSHIGMIQENEVWVVFLAHQPQISAWQICRFANYFLVRWKLLNDCIYDSLSLMNLLILPNMNKARFYYWSIAWACAKPSWYPAFGSW